MQIDRARFLLLTASLAGGGCAPASPDPVVPPEPTAAPTSTESEVVVPETPEPATTASGETTSQTTSSSTPDEPPAGSCDNDTGTVPACAITKPPGPFCESFTETKAACKFYKQVLRDGVAAKAVTCLNAASGSQAVCDFSLTEACASAAIRTACIQPSTFNQCSPVVTACAGNQWSKLGMDDCQKLLSSVKDGKRQAMITCMTEGCSLESCTWMLR